jgi:hypothetical protein
MKAIETIRKHIKQIPRGKPIVAASLGGMASPGNIRQTFPAWLKPVKLSVWQEGFSSALKKLPI